MKLIDLTGSRFGRLTVMRRAGNASTGDAQWLCICDCGETVTVRGTRLRSGESRSCSCLQKEIVSSRNSTHRLSKSPEYRSWSSMIARCENPKYHHYHRYGGRGITICDRWRDSFESFLADMGPRPSLSHSIDRYPDNDGNYEPGNCRWATPAEQRHNRSDSREFRRFKS